MGDLSEPASLNPLAAACAAATAQVKEYLGEEERTLVDYILRMLAEQASRPPARRGRACGGGAEPALCTGCGRAERARL